MKKLTLDVETLEVNSFETQSQKPGALQAIFNPLTIVDPFESLFSVCGSAL